MLYVPCLPAVGRPFAIVGRRRFNEESCCDWIGNFWF
jgi:hypothetical protein